MTDVSYLAKKRGEIRDVVIVYPYTYVNPFLALPPIAAEYLQAGLVAAGCNTTLLDMRFEDDVGEALSRADLVCLYGFFEDCSIFGSWSIHVIPEVLAQIPDGTPVVAGGTGFSKPEKALAKWPKLDVVIRGIPDAAIRALVETGSPVDVENLVYRKGSEVVRNRSVNHLPDDVFPLRELRNPSYDYHLLGLPVDLMRAAIGCNYRCRFCYDYGKDSEGNFLRWQSRSAESQFRELSRIEAPIVFWVDDDMTTDMKSLDSLADRLLGSGVEKMMIGTGRIDHVVQSDVGMLKKLERAGLLALAFGVESLNDDTLKFYRKGQTVDDVDRAMQMMNETDILLVCNFLLGSPGDSEQDMMEFLEFGRRWDVDTIVTNRLKVAKGSDLDRQIRDPETDEPIPGRERIRGKELKRIKNVLKFGQRTPFRLLLSLLKAFRHEGVFIDPLHLVASGLESATRGTWLHRSGVSPALFWLPKKVTSLRGFRRLTRGMAILATPPAKWVNRAYERFDARVGLSTRVMPAAFALFQRGYMDEQKRRVQSVAGRRIRSPDGGRPQSERR